MANPRPTPDAAQRDPKSVHMLSVWLAENSLHCNLKIGVFANHPTVVETQAWGTILADVARAIADAMIADGTAQEPREDVINRIWTSFHESMSQPASA